MKWISVKVKRRTSVTEILGRKQIWYQQSNEREQSKSIICSEENKLSMWLSNWLQGTKSWRLNWKWVTFRQCEWITNVELLKDLMDTYLGSWVLESVNVKSEGWIQSGSTELLSDRS